MQRVYNVLCGIFLGCIVGVVFMEFDPHTKELYMSKAGFHVLYFELPFQLFVSSKKIPEVLKRKI